MNKNRFREIYEISRADAVAQNLPVESYETFMERKCEECYRELHHLQVLVACDQDMRLNAPTLLESLGVEPFREQEQIVRRNLTAYMLQRGWDFLTRGTETQIQFMGGRIKIYRGKVESKSERGV